MKITNSIIFTSILGGSLAFSGCSEGRNNDYYEENRQKAISYILNPELRRKKGESHFKITDPELEKTVKDFCGNYNSVMNIGLPQEKIINFAKEKYGINEKELDKISNYCKKSVKLNLDNNSNFNELMPDNK